MLRPGHNTAPPAVRRIENARHFTPEDHPEVIAAAVDEVLDEVRSQA